jgi:hypothetical protein
MPVSEPELTPQKDELAKENQLLLALETTASEHARLGRSWAKYFRKWRDVNDDLIDKPDAAFKEELGNEVRHLEKMLSSLTGDSSAGAQFWRDMLELDIADAKRLKG